VRVRLFVPANANNWACAAAQQFHHGSLLAAGVRLEYPTMLHAKAFVRDGEELLAGTCNLEAWSLKRFVEIDLLLRSPTVAAQFDERFSVPAEAVSAAGRRLTGVKERAKAALFAGLSPLLDMTALPGPNSHACTAGRRCLHVRQPPLLVLWAVLSMIARGESRS
jgi:phosphatidylserine/phosphatidylglycerophosphate/cardiolipin synthase-like enzyme